MRNQMGAWCGYVAVEPDHPFHGVDGYRLPLQVHGGITFSDSCQDGRTIFGFDAAHAFDLVPSMVRLWSELGYSSRDHLSYRSISYMRAECESLARQLKQAQ